MSKKTAIRILWTMGLLGLVVGLWLREGPLAYNVAQQRAILLGRYTEEQLTVQLIVTPIVLLIVLMIWTKREKTPEEKRRDAFRLILLVGSILGTVIAADIVLRRVEGTPYLRSAKSHRRPANQSIRGIFLDTPDTDFTFPNAPAGYPPIEYTLTTDARGFRNRTTLSSCDMVVVGDSFAEGTGVSDESVWPVLLGQQRGWAVCNLAMSGTSPPAYLDILRQYGFALTPKMAICLLYAGNDFRDDNYQTTTLEAPRPTLGRILFYGSPIRAKLKKLMIRTLGPIGRHRFEVDPMALADPRHAMYAVSWLPMIIPGHGGNPYVFELKRLCELYRKRDELAQSQGVGKTLKLLDEMRHECEQHDIRLIVAFVPDKSQVVLTAGREWLDANRLRAFMALKKHDLPPGEELVSEVIDRIGGLESIVDASCREKGIEFISLTGPLREAMLAGQRVYYTYDQHISPEGHRIVAEKIAQQIP